jgi:hypothetical protein
LNLFNLMYHVIYMYSFLEKMWKFLFSNKPSKREVREELVCLGRKKLSEIAHSYISSIRLVAQ